MLGVSAAASRSPWRCCGSCGFSPAASSGVGRHRGEAAPLLAGHARAGPRRSGAGTTSQVPSCFWIVVEVLDALARSTSFTSLGRRGCRRRRQRRRERRARAASSEPPLSYGPVCDDRDGPRATSCWSSVSPLARRSSARRPSQRARVTYCPRHRYSSRGVRQLVEQLAVDVDVDAVDRHAARRRGASRRYDVRRQQQVQQRSAGRGTGRPCGLLSPAAVARARSASSR